MTQRISLAALALLLFVAQAPAQVHFSKEERRIITLTDERRGVDTIASYLNSSNTRVAWRAAIGLANIGDTTVREKLLHDYEAESRDSVRDAEAFAIGMLGPNDQAYHNLGAFGHPTHQRVIAWARTVLPAQIDNFAERVSKARTNREISDKDAAEGLMRAFETRS